MTTIIETHPPNCRVPGRSPSPEHCRVRLVRNCGRRTVQPAEIEEGHSLPCLLLRIRGNHTLGVRTRREAKILEGIALDQEASSSQAQLLRVVILMTSVLSRPCSKSGQAAAQAVC